MSESNVKNFNGIVVDDGSVREVIRNKLGEEIGVFVFRPTDIGIVDRFNKVAAEFDKITAPLENVNINADGTVDENNEDELAAFKEAEKRLFEACDYAFGGNMSAAFFGKMNPFSPVNGKFYCENALDVVGAYIAKQFNKETAKINARVERYTHGYRTGKHKNGGKKGNKKR
ncbi:MAG: hypothetical protein NC177_16390 [Ruminococcus flavefaciens]|nr:hypothetical protein [Ruminococcus flavefaciens]